MFLESISEDGQLAIGLEATEDFLGLQQAGGGPSERHLGVSPAFDVAGGLVPRQYSSGGKERLGRISKRGDSYIRRLLVHGARADLRWSKHRKERRSIWQESLLARRPTNVVLVAMANKTARVVWAMLSRGEAFRTGARSAA